MYPDATVSDAENYCRSFNDTAPWCYTTDPTLRHDFCNVPFCEAGKKEDIVKVSETANV